jgi:hypothetical protein
MYFLREQKKVDFSSLNKVKDLLKQLGSRLISDPKTLYTAFSTEFYLSDDFIQILHMRTDTETIITLHMYFYTLCSKNAHLFFIPLTKEDK